MWKGVESLHLHKYDSNKISVIPSWSNDLFQSERSDMVR
jgi:hypothetical protein